MNSEGKDLIMAELSKNEKKALLSKWKNSQKKKYILSREEVENLFCYLETQIENSYCDKTLRYTEQWLKENVPFNKIEDVITELKEMGGFCDCEVIFNCYETYCDENKGSLKDEIQIYYEKYIAEFHSIPEDLKDIRRKNTDKTPAENLAYLVGCTTLLMKLENSKENILEIKFPLDKLTWSQISELHQWSADTYSHLPLKKLKDILANNVEKIYTMVDTMSEEKLFGPYYLDKKINGSIKLAKNGMYELIRNNIIVSLGILRVQIIKWKKSKS